MKKHLTLAFCLLWSISAAFLTGCNAHSDDSLSAAPADGSLTEQSSEFERDSTASESENGGEDSSVVLPSDSSDEGPVIFRLVQDPNHRLGFNVKGQKDGIGTHIGRLVYDSEPEEDSVWELAQWECGYYHRDGQTYPSEHNIMNAEKNVSEDGTYQWTDASKVFRSNPQTGAVYLGLDASKEYEAPRVQNAPWPHLLLEYTLSQSLKAAELMSLTLEMDFTLEEFTNHMEAGTESAALHTAQFMWYMIVRNGNPNSPDYGYYMWFGVDLFDRRYENDFAPLYAMQDTGKEVNTGAYIYQPAAKDILTEPTAVGREQIVSADLLPYIRKAFLAAQKAKFLVNTRFNDLVIAGGNFGWEMTGTYSGAMTVSKFDLVAERSY